MSRGLLELRLDCLKLHLGVVEVLYRGERATHRAGDKHQWLISFQQLDRLGSFAGHREIPRFAIVGVHLHKVQCPGWAQSHFPDQLCDPGRRIDFAALGFPFVRQQLPAIHGLRHLELLLLAQVIQNLPNS